MNSHIYATIKHALNRFAAPFLLSNHTHHSQALAIGIKCSAQKAYSFASGFQAFATLYGERASAAGTFSLDGSGQHSLLHARIQTTDDTPTELRLDGNSERITLPSLAIWTYTIRAVARRIDGGNEGAGYIRHGVIINDTATTRIIGTQTDALTVEDTAAWDCVPSADAGNTALAITVTGERDKTINWYAAIEIAQLIGAPV